MTDSIRILSMPVLEYIRLNPGMYLPAGDIHLGVKLAQLLVVDSLALGATDVRVLREQDWFAVSADRDWLALGHGGSNVGNLFSSVTPMPEAGVNSIRHEVVVAAFSHDVVTAGHGDPVVLRAGNDPDALAIGMRLCRESHPRRVIAFRCDGQR